MGFTGNEAHTFPSYYFLIYIIPKVLYCLDEVCAIVIVQQVILQKSQTEN